MRHFIWYDTNGSLRGCETRDRGFGPNCDLRDPNTTDPVAVYIRSRRTANPEFAGFFALDCECDPALISCQCPYNKLSSHYFDAGELHPKPERSVWVNDSILPDGQDEPVDLPPGASAELEISGSIPDGHKLLIKNVGRVAPFLLAQDTEAAFNNGRVSVTITVPPQGASGIIVAESRYVRRIRVLVRGWE